jgi:hypothetical protein
MRFVFVINKDLISRLQWGIETPKASACISYGWRDPQHTATMPMDAIFRIALQTKLIVTVAALQLVSS